MILPVKHFSVKCSLAAGLELGMAMRSTSLQFPVLDAVVVPAAVHGAIGADGWNTSWALTAAVLVIRILGLAGADSHACIQ